MRSKSTYCTTFGEGYTVKIGLFSIAVPQTVPLQITDLSNKYLGKVVFVLLHKFVFVITQTPFFRSRTPTVLVHQSGTLTLPQYNAGKKDGLPWGGGGEHWEPPSPNYIICCGGLVGRAEQSYAGGHEFDPVQKLILDWTKPQTFP